ncbi:unnamed protein product, partial [marine sediment metagenome]
LSLGSNLGNREKNLNAARERLTKVIERMRMSRIYETEPLYVTNQPLFLNAVISGFAALSCFDLLDLIKTIEKQMGRNRDHELANGPRTLDIDILLFGKTVLNTDRLIIPHPKIGERMFVLIPLIELDPEIKNPATGISYSESLNKITEQGVYTYDPKHYNLFLNSTPKAFAGHKK